MNTETSVPIQFGHIIGLTVVKPPPLPYGVTVDAFRVALNLVSELFMCPTCQILSRRRDARVAWPRHVVMWLIRECVGASYQSIGEAMQRDHGSVIHGCNRVRQIMSAYPKEQQRLMELKLKMDTRLKTEQQPLMWQ